MIRRILYALRVLRLAMFMLLGAGIGQVMGLSTLSHSYEERAEEQFHGAIFGALCGFAVELVARQILPSPKHDFAPLRFTLRTLLIVIMYASILLGLIAYLVNK